MLQWVCVRSLWIFPLVIGVVRAASSNRTIDDQYGDSVTGAIPYYVGYWNYGPNCKNCDIDFQYDPSLCFDNSWHTAVETSLLPPTHVNFTFVGTAIYVFAVIPDDPQTMTNLTFTMNNDHVGTFYAPNTNTEVAYNALVYVNKSMPNDQYTLQIKPQYGTEMSYFAFDYAIYTFEDSTTLPIKRQSWNENTPTLPIKQPSPHTRAIVGGTIGGAAAITILALVVFFLRRRIHRYVDDIRQLWDGQVSGTTQETDNKPVNVNENAAIEPVNTQMSQDAFVASPSLASPPRLLSPMASVSRLSRGVMDFVQRLRHVRVSGITQDAVIEPFDVNEQAVVEPQHAFAASSPPASLPRSLSPMISASRLSHGFMDYMRQLRHGDVSGITQDADTKRLDLNEDTVIKPPESQMSHHAFGASPSLASLPRSTSPVGSAARFSTSDYAPQRQQLTYQVREMERTVTDLKIRRGEDVTPPSTARPGERGHTTDAALIAQLEALQREVERLRAAQEEAMAPPPPY